MAMKKPVAGKLQEKHKIREQQHGPVDFDEIRERIEGALKGTGLSPGINKFGEVIFKPDEPSKKTDGKKEETRSGKDTHQFKLGIPELDRILEEKSLPKAPDIDRIKTGIPGLDELITGGIPRDSTIVVAGSPGAGKTIFALQFLYNGAVLFNEPGVYISFEEDPKSLKEAGRLFGWDLEALDKKQKIQVVFKDPYEIKSFATAFGGQIYQSIRESKARRVVFDSITYFSLTQENKFKLRKEITELGKRLKALDITTLFISEVPEAMQHGHYNSGDEISAEFSADGVIRLHNMLAHGTRQRAIEVMKLRKTNHDTFLHPFSITDQGIVVYPKEQVFSE